MPKAKDEDQGRKGKMTGDNYSSLLGELEALKAKIEAMSGGEEIEDADIEEEEKGYEKEEGKEGEAKKELSEKTAHEGDEKEEEKNGEDAEGEYKKFVNKAGVEDDMEEEKLSQDNDKPGDMSKPKDKGMDAKAVMREISLRDALAKRLSDHIGTFDHSLKTHKEVARYGIKKLGLQCASGHEISMIEGYLRAARKQEPVAMARDAALKSSCIDAYLKGSN